ncbi:YfiR family protein [Paraburkholderia sp. SIMBA_030]|uniref:YfiR family protein n=1 Tax=Paraburkholderia sp. SIMBA_030 TaxID=3085773 RepID=UPI00397DC4B2
MPFARILCSASARTFVIWALITGLVYAQADESELKAAYIFNFTQFTTWPAGSLSDAALFVCANRDSYLGGALSKLDGRTVGGRAWSVIPLPSKSGQSRCNVIVLENEEQMSHAAKEVVSPDQPVLVISDFDAGDRTAVIRLFIDENHLRFDIDNQLALRLHLSLSSKLLRLARNVL